MAEHNIEIQKKTKTDFDAILRKKEICILDLNHYLKTYAFDKQSSEIRKDEKKCIQNLYEVFTTIKRNNSHYLNPSFLTTTNAGMILLEIMLQKSFVKTIPSILYKSGNFIVSPGGREFARTYFSRYISENKILVFTDGMTNKMAKVNIDNAMSCFDVQLPRIAVKKRILKHRGEGVSFYTPAQYSMIFDDLQDGDIIQPFIYSGNKDFYQTDTRITIVGDEISCLYKRESASKFSISGLTENLEDSHAMLLTNVCRGGNSIIQENHTDYKELINQAFWVRDHVNAMEKQFRRIYNIDLPFQGIDYLSIDFLKDSNGGFRFLEVHYNPSLIEECMIDGARYLSEYIMNYQKEHKFNEVVILGNEKLTPYIETVLAKNGIKFSTNL